MKAQTRLQFDNPAGLASGGFLLRHKLRQITFDNMIKLRRQREAREFAFFLWGANWVEELQARKPHKNQLNLF